MRRADYCRVISSSRCHGYLTVPSLVWVGGVKSYGLKRLQFAPYIHVCRRPISPLWSSAIQLLAATEEVAPNLYVFFYKIQFADGSRFKLFCCFMYNVFHRVFLRRKVLLSMLNLNVRVKQICQQLLQFLKLTCTT